MSKTITRLFDHYEDAEQAVSNLESMGVPHHDISLVGNNAHGRHRAAGQDSVNEDGDVSRGTSTGAVLGGVGGLLAGLGLLAIPGLGPVVAAGWLASTAVGAGIGAAGGAATGGIVGALKEAGHSDEDAHAYSEGVRRGGTLVSAKVDDALVPQVEASLNDSRAVDMGTRAESYRTAGWSRFDETAPAYTTDEINRDRTAYGVNSRY